jgi:hypothetical protein
VNKTSHEAALASHESAESGIEVEDDVHRHFQELSANLDDWCAVAEEGRRLLGVMLKQKIEDWSAGDVIISGVAAAAYELAISDVARELEVSAFALKCGIEGHEESGVAGFLAECQKYNQPREEPRS